MDKGFVPYEEVLELRDLGLKDLGDNEPFFGEYRQWDGGTPWLQLYQDLDSCSTDPADYEYTLEGQAPTYQQAFDWLERNHSVYVERRADTSVNEVLDIVYFIKSWKFPPVEVVFENPYDCFDKEKSNLACLRKIIELLKPN